MTIYFIDIIHTDEFDKLIHQSMYRPKLCSSMKDVKEYIKRRLIEHINIQILLNFNEDDDEYHMNEYIKKINADQDMNDLKNSRDHYTQGISGHPQFDWVIHAYHDEELKKLIQY